jgi:hypothetical protein
MTVSYGAVIFRAASASVIFRLGKDFKDYFRKGIYCIFIFSGFFLIWGFCVKKFEKWPSERLHCFLEIGHIGYLKKSIILC